MAERRNPRRIVAGVAGVTLLLAVIAAFALYSLMTRSLPRIEGEQTLAALSGEVSVIRDPAGFPHILASSDYDAYVATGYVHAQDRLWQMDLMRRYGQGRLAEVLGSPALPIDRMMRTVGLSQIADSLWNTVSEQTRNILRAYSAGVNARMQEMDGRYPMEFDVLQYTPEEWTPQNSLLIVRLMGWELALSWWVDLTLDELQRKLGEEKTRELFPSESDGMPPVLPPDLAHEGDVTGTSALAALPGETIRAGLRAAQELFGSAGSAIGSNAWAVTRSRSARGGALIANDPHLLHMQPARFYILHLHTPDLNVAGATIPGAPGVIIGHNGHIAWGMTNLMADDVDFFVENINERDSTYRLEGRVLPLEVRTDSIFVRDSVPVVLTQYRTIHGPVITSSYPLDGVLRAPDRFTPPPAVSMRWAGQDPSDELLALFRANRARNWTEFVSAYASFGVPALNLIFGDSQGNIGFTVAGRVPLRAAAVSPLLRNDGTQIETPWRGYVPYEQLPRAFNPPGDAVASANNRPAFPLPYHISSLWEGDGRIRR
ncbi:MAG: penicillin acylase family protein, partial [Bacteroidetes bacterium]|nr:penicillin acylase family protein [Bacteroidota bacterium]